MLIHHLSRGAAEQHMAGHHLPQNRAQRVEVRADTTVAQATTLIDKMNQVRAAGLSVVEFRGCTIGRVSENLAALKDFLGAAEAGGPDVLSTYGAVTPKIVSSAQFDHWQSLFVSTAVFASMSSGRVGFRITVVSGGNSCRKMRPISPSTRCRNTYAQALKRRCFSKDTSGGN